MKIEIVTMTPEWALQILLEQNTCNRLMRLKMVKGYAQAIRAGQWKLTQQGIAIGTNGVLLDGQHRLAAIVEADQPVQIALATECDPSIFSVLDTGTKRGAADVLQVKGVTHATTSAAALKLYIMNQRHPDRVWAGNWLQFPSHADIEELNAKRTDTVAYAASIAYATYRNFKKINKGATAAFVMLCLDAGWTTTQVEFFCKRLGNGVGLTDNSPVLRLRTAIINEVVNRNHNYKNQTHLACLIKAYNYEAEGAELKLFKTPAIPPMPTVIAA